MMTMKDLEHPIGSWPFWRASIVIVLISGVVGAIMALLV